MSEEKLEQLLTLIKELKSTFPSDYSERFDKIEELLFDFSGFLVKWVFITAQINKEKYISIIGKEKFEEFIEAIGNFSTKISASKE